MAEQREPIKRRVALKIIKLGMDTKQVIARFEAERQALAMMDHPNIARVFDAGATDTGRPYFVMELVRGVSMTEYCDSEDLPMRNRLGLFIKVCHAVQHAHQKGIIHRDIKPSNVMITLHDDEAVPKIIDFGIAKATNRELTDKTLFTELRQFVGTPAYMSPEQAEMSGLDIDTRCDIYSLGVLLYELLTGTTPFEATRLQSAAFAEVQRIILEEDPPRPSQRVSTLQDRLVDIARHRRTEPVGLAKLVRGDLDWIVMKALEKNRGRRYATALELAADIDRHFKNEPVNARPPSKAYRLRKFVTKHRGPVAAVSAICVAIVLLGSVAMWQGTRAKREGIRVRTIGIVASAAAAKDPLLKAQLVKELETLPDVPGRLSVASEAANCVLPIAVFRGHERSLTGATFSPDGKHVATSSRDGTVRIWRVDGTAAPIVLKGFPLGVSEPSFSRDGRYVTASSNYRVYVWRTDGTGDPVLIEPEGPGYPEWDPNFAVSPDAKSVIAGSSDGTVRLWSIEGKGEPIELLGHESTVTQVAISSDGLRAVTASKDGIVRLWHLGATAGSVVLGRHDDRITKLKFSKDDQQILSSSGDGTAKLWPADGRGQPIVLRGAEGVRVNNAFLLPGTPLVVTICSDKIARCWKIDESDPPTIVKLESDVEGGSISPDGRHAIVFSGNAARIRRTDGSGEPLFLRGHEFPIGGAAFSPDSELVVTFGEKTARVWRVDASGESLDLEGPDTLVRSAAFSPDGSALVTGNQDGTIRVRTIYETAPALNLPALRSQVEAVAFSPDGSQILAVSADGRAQVARADGRGSPTVFEEDDAKLTSASFGPDGVRVATGSSNGMVRIWLIDRSDDPIELEGHEKAVSCVAISPNGDLVASGSEDNTIRIWRVDGSGEPVVLRGHRFSVWSVAFSPDGKRLVSTEPTALGAHVWHTDGSGDPVTFSGHLDEVLSAAFSPDGEHVLTASTDATARVWRADNGQEVAVLRGHRWHVWSAAFSPDGTRIVTASPFDKTIRVWPSDGASRPMILGPHARRTSNHGAPINVSFSPEGSRVLSVGLGTARVWTVTWPELQEYLQANVNSCMTPEHRQWYLAEPADIAWSTYSQCERSHGRVPDGSLRPIG